MDGLPRTFGVRPPSPACTPSSPTHSRSGESCTSFWPKSSARRRLVSPSRHLILSRLGRCAHCSCRDCFWGGRRRILGFGSLSHRKSVRISFLFFRHLLISYARTLYLQSPRLRLNKRYLARTLRLVTMDHFASGFLPTHATNHAYSRSDIHISLSVSLLSTPIDFQCNRRALRAFIPC